MFFQRIRSTKRSLPPFSPFNQLMRHFIKSTYSFPSPLTKEIFPRPVLIQAHAPFSDRERKETGAWQSHGVCNRRAESAFGCAVTGPTRHSAYAYGFGVTSRRGDSCALHTPAPLRGKLALQVYLTALTSLRSFPNGKGQNSGNQHQHRVFGLPKVQD